MTASLTVCRQVLRALARYPDNIAFEWDGGAWSYRATHDMIGRFQHVFVREGLRRGDRMVLLSANRADAWSAGIAAQGLGCAISSLHTMASLEDHLFQVSDFQPKAVIIDPHTYAQRGRDLAERLDLSVKVFTLGPADFGMDLLSEAEKHGSATPIDVAAVDDLAEVMYTGGTTGRPKGAARSHRPYPFRCISSAADYELSLRPRYLAVAPISHVAGGMVMPTLERGGTICLQQGFDPSKVLHEIETKKIDLTVLVPTMIYALLGQPELANMDLSSMRNLIYAGAPMSPSKLELGLERFGKVFTQLYGQTETYQATVLRACDHDPARPDLLSSCGVPSMIADVRIVDEDGQDVPRGDPGEVIIRSPLNMDYYLNLPELTAETLKSGWIYTGDIAVQNDAGYISIVDRKKDMIVTGGFNVYPRGVEDVLTADSDVAMAAVIGVPDDKWGERVHAIVLPVEGAQLDAQALLSNVKDKLGSVQTPKAIDIVDEIPLTAVGKIDKKALRAPFWSDKDRAVG